MINEILPSLPWPSSVHLHVNSIIHFTRAEKKERLDGNCVNGIKVKNHTKEDKGVSFLFLSTTRKPKEPSPTKNRENCNNCNNGLLILIQLEQ